MASGPQRIAQGLESAVVSTREENRSFWPWGISTGVSCAIVRLVETMRAAATAPPAIMRAIEAVPAPDACRVAMSNLLSENECSREEAATAKAVATSPTLFSSPRFPECGKILGQTPQEALTGSIAASIPSIRKLTVTERWVCGVAR